MKAVIMAGGRGTRIAALAGDLPKPMLPIDGRPVLERELGSLREQGVTDVLITVGHLAPAIMEYFGDGSGCSPQTGRPFGVHIEYFVEKEPLGNAGALFRIRDRLDEDFLLLNGDVMFDVDLQRFAAFHKVHGGLATLFTELIPKFQVGVVEFSVEYFLFIPLTLAMLFDPLSAALGAATGELVFSEIMLGQFGGLGELEKFLTVTIGVYIAGRLVKDPRNRALVGVAAITGTAAQLLMGTVVDILKVQLAVEDFEAVAGLPESVFATEGFAFLNDLLFSGILFCLLPTLYLVPKLYGKIEPLLGMAPRTPESAVSGISPKALIVCAVGFVCAIVAELAATAGMSLIDWEAEWAESGTAMAVGMVAAAAVAIIALLVIKKNAGKKAAVN